MKINEAIKLAIRSIHVDDSHELNDLRLAFELVQSEFPFINFVHGPPNEIPFESDIALVMTKVEGRDSHKMRQLKRSDGRKTFHAPSLRITSPIDINVITEYMRSQIGVEETSHEVMQYFKRASGQELKTRILLGLMYSAETEGKVLNVKRDSLRGAVKKLVEDIDGPVSVLVGAPHRAHITDMPFSYEIAPEGEAQLVYELREEVLLVVPRLAGRVGTVRIDSLPEMFATPGEPGIVKCSAIFEAGFWFKGNAGITKIVVDSAQ